MTAIDFIDVSAHQGAIDWAAVPVPAIIKATEGRTFTDPRFHENFIGAGQAGKLLGVYHFLTSTSPGAAQARHFLDTVGAPAPVWVLDWETDTTGTLPGVATAQEFISEFRALAPDRNLVLYGNDARRGFAIRHRLPFWCAWYPASTQLDDGGVSIHETRQLDAVERSLRTAGDWAWQWTSSATVPGIAGRVDANRFLATPPTMEGQPMPITDDDLIRIRAFCGLDPVPTRDYNDDGTFKETAPLPVVQLAANAHIEAQLASLAADRANATANTLAVVVSQLRQEWDDLHLTTMPAISDEQLVGAVKRTLRELFA